MTQRITRVDECNYWQMKDDDHRLWSSPENGEAALEVRKYRDGCMEIYATEIGKRDKNISMYWKSDIVRSLLEFLNAAYSRCQQESAANGRDGAGADSTATQISELDNRLT
jgi:hypothetical protein